jgi:hypothetical protein
MEQNENITPAPKVKRIKQKRRCKKCCTPKIRICPDGHSNYILKKPPKIVTTARRWFWRTFRFFIPRRTNNKAKA